MVREFDIQPIVLVGPKRERKIVCSSFYEMKETRKK